MRMMVCVKIFIFVVFFFILLVGQVIVFFIEVGIDEVFIVDGQVFIFDFGQSGDRFFVSVLSYGEEMYFVFVFGENIIVGNVIYVIGLYDCQNQRFIVYIFGNYISVRVMKKYDFGVEVIEVFDIYVKVKIKNMGFYLFNDIFFVLLFF